MNKSGDAAEGLDNLWDDLNLGGLLDDLARENATALAQAKKIQAKNVSDMFAFHMN